MNLDIDTGVIIDYTISDDRIKELWSMLPKGNNMWAAGDGADFRTFSKALKSSIMVFVLDFGYVRLESVLLGSTATVHGAFVGPSLFKNIHKLYTVAKILEKLYKIEQVEVSIPLGSFSLQRLLFKIGFKRVGPGTTLIRTGAGVIPGDLWILGKEVWNER